MGLDMYAFAVPQGSGEDFAVEGERSELAYWRKFNALHGYMEDLAREKGFEGEFNCVPVLLTPADLTDLEEAIKEGTLRPREGFFFGTQEIDESDVEATVQFISEAREAQANGKDVYYDSWW